VDYYAARALWQRDRSDSNSDGRDFQLELGRSARARWRGFREVDGLHYRRRRAISLIVMRQTVGEESRGLEVKSRESMGR
jgi:hypothetical protein